MTLNGVMVVILRYFSEFTYLPGVLRKSSRSLSHLLMSSCFNMEPGLSQLQLRCQISRPCMVTPVAKRTVENQLLAPMWGHRREAPAEIHFREF